MAIRTKAVKCLTAVVEADPTLLSRVSDKLISHEIERFSKLYADFCYGLN